MGRIQPMSENREPVKRGDSEPTKTWEWFGKRHIQMFLLFTLLAISFGMKVNLSIGIVAMTDPSVNPSFPTFSWTAKEKSLLLSSLFWGYIVPQVPAGQLAERHGSKWILTFAMASCALFTFLIPKMAEHSFLACVVCRVLQGFFQGFFYPCVHKLLSKWVPQNERSAMGVLVYSGTQFGIILAMLLTGEMAASPLGWPSAFYLYAILGVIWVLFWSSIGENSPNDHKSISDGEKAYILNSYGYPNHAEYIPTPWRKILLSLPFWAILVANCGNMWCYWTLVNEVPTYLNNVLRFDISANGILLALQYLVGWILGFPYALLTDFLINRRTLTIGAARKLAVAIGFFGPAIALLILGTEEKIIPSSGIILLTIATGINSVVLSGYQVNHIDISPTHASTLIGITNGISNISGIVVPIVVQQIVSVEDDVAQWNTVFLLTVGVYIVSGIVFITLGSGEMQDWDKLETQSKNDFCELFQKT